MPMHHTPSQRLHLLSISQMGQTWPSNCTHIRMAYAAVTEHRTTRKCLVWSTSLRYLHSAKPQDSCAVPSMALHSHAWVRAALPLRPTAADLALSRAHGCQVARNTLVPAWQERLGFSDVALGDTLSLSIFDHKKLTSDLFLGQVGSLPWWGCFHCEG